jgi:hypothetical protein
MAFRMEYEEGEMPEAPRREVLDGVLVGLVGLVTLVFVATGLGWMLPALFR